MSSLPADSSTAPPSEGDQRPGSVTAAGVIGIVLGSLGIVLRVLQVTVIGNYFVVDAFLTLLVPLGVIVGLLLLVGGIEAVQGDAPRRLLLGSYGSMALTLVDQVWFVSRSEGLYAVGLVSLILPALIVFLLMRPSAREYRSRTPAGG
jgi:hypothetical protein